MRINIKQKVQSSLFLKVLLVFALAMIAIISVAVATDGVLSHRKHHPQLRTNKVQYGQYLIKDIGSPPDTSYARLLSDSLGLQIRLQTAALNWVSKPGMVGFADLTVRNYRQNDRIRVGWQESIGFCVAIRNDEAQYLFVLRSEREEMNYAFALYTAIVTVSAILVIVGIYFAMRWLLRPVKDLNEGVQQLTRGNLEYEVPGDRSDELGELVSSFNSMTNRVKEMIHAREQLLLDVSHELRSPLTRSKVALEFLENSKTRKEIGADIVEMETLITEILESQRLNSEYGGVNCQPTNLSALVKNVCEDFRKQKPGLKMNSFSDSVYLELDPERTRILFKNVLANAFQYSDVDSSPVEVSLLENNGEVVVAVQDFGAGIPQQDLPYIFEPFYRVDKSRSKDTGGYGLGMSLSKKIMEAHGGDIEISSRLKQGTTIYLKFRR